MEFGNLNSQNPFLIIMLTTAMKIIILQMLMESSIFLVFPHNCTLGQDIECLFWAL